MSDKQNRMDAPKRQSVPAPHFSCDEDLVANVAGLSSHVDSAAVADPASVPDSADKLGCGCHEASHLTELQVRRHLMSQSQLSFSSLVVRRMNNGVCLQGVVEATGTEPDLAQLVRQVAAVDRVISQVVVRPRKG